MKLVGKVFVEPLDDERLTNIERNLVLHVSGLSQRRLVRAPRRLLAFAGVALAVVVAGFVGWKIRGDGTLEIAPKVERFAMTDGALDLGDAQITGKDFAVTRSEGRVEVVMQPGLLDLHVEHLPERLFVVRAGDVEIEDVGTRFTVDFDGTQVDVRVTEGEVKVKRAGKEEAVKAGEAWTIELGRITIAQLDDKQAAEALAIVMADVPSDDVATDVPPDRTSTDVPPDGDAATAGAGTASAGTSDDPSGVTGGSASASQTATTSRKPGKANARKALDKASYDPPIDVGTEDPKQAIAKYIDLLRHMPEGEDKAEVLYSIAFMQHRAKQDDAAHRTLMGVLRRQGGPSYQAALWLSLRIHCSRAFDDDCRIAAQKYVAKFASGARAGIAEEILREISRGP